MRTVDMESGTLNNREAADCNSFAGSWPFRFLGEAANPREVEKELGNAGFRRSWISPLDALFNPEPYAGNEWLARETNGSEILRPAPVFNPCLTGAGAEAAAFLSRHTVTPAIRLAPGYHNYAVGCPETRRFLEQLSPEPVIVVTLRLQDRRAQSPVFKVPDLALDPVLDLAAAFPGRNFLLCGIRLGEVTGAGACWGDLPNVFLETSFLDGLTAIADAVTAIGAERLLLGTLAPLFYARAVVDQITASGLPEETTRQILRGKVLIP